MHPATGNTSRNARLIGASPQKVYNAFTNPEALAVWLAPGDMTGKIHQFEAKVGSGYSMSLFYPASTDKPRGKTSGQEDRFTATFLELAAPCKVVQAIRFHSDDPAFSGEMIMDVTVEAQGPGTLVIIEFRNIPPGIRPEDNEMGTQLSLEKLARYLESDKTVD